MNFAIGVYKICYNCPWVQHELPYPAGSSELEPEELQAKLEQGRSVIADHTVENNHAQKKKVPNSGFSSMT